MTAITSANLLTIVNRYIRVQGIPPSRFGRDAVNDPAFISGLRAGREPRAKTIERVRVFLAQADA